MTNQVTEGDQVVTEVVFRGTRTGPLAGRMGTILATGKKAELLYAFVSSSRTGTGGLASYAVLGDRTEGRGRPVRAPAR